MAELYRCKECRKEFVTKILKKKFCSDKCRKRYWYLKNKENKKNNK